MIEATGIDVNDTLSKGMLADSNVKKLGEIRVAAASAHPIPLAENGILVKLKFRTKGKKGISQLIFTEFMFNEGDPSAIAENGKVTIQ